MKWRCLWVLVICGVLPAALEAQTQWFIWGVAPDDMHELHSGSLGGTAGAGAGPKVIAYELCLPGEIRRIGNHANNRGTMSCLRARWETSVVPGQFFEMPEHFRIGIGGETRMTSEGLDRLSDALKDWKSRE